jgi:hypothetical protein
MESVGMTGVCGDGRGGSRTVATKRAFASEKSKRDRDFKIDGMQAARRLPLLQGVTRDRECTCTRCSVLVVCLEVLQQARLKVAGGGG